MSALHPIATAKADMPQTVMSALPPTADLCSPLADVCFGPKADIDCKKEKPPWRRSLRNLVKRFCSGCSGLSVGLHEDQQVSIYCACVGGRAAVREALVGLQRSVL